ncbi:ankyrin repeat domain-containing protein EMB506, chloroplastic-like, partial [Phalaenopsis equestris]|uniref:ankyrin repeat domain-containing protein EMB506, chloroplastic-like n=1 Tax=Phalaenopsis equestris TaxID=78828 RepID=UPI0009E5FCAC
INCFDFGSLEVEQLLEPEERDILQQNEVPDISKISTKKWNLFHSLGLSLQIHLMDKLLELGWDIDSADKDGYTALHKTVMGKKEAVISHLLRKGANPLIRDRNGATALHYAVQAGAMQTVKLLIKHKVDVNVADNDGWTPLHISMQSRSRDIAKVLLVNGADKSRRNKDGMTPLDLSLCYGRDFKSYDLAKLLKLVPADRDF